MSLYEELCSMELLKAAYRKVTEGGKKYTRAAILFEEAREYNLAVILYLLRTKKYAPGPYSTFKVWEPKERTVSAPDFPDKVVQQATHRILQKVYAPVFIKDSYACLLEKGQHLAVRVIQGHIRQAARMWGGAWIVKIDVRKFFYSIDREILKRLYRKKIDDADFLRHLDLIVDSSPEGERGLPLGNVTSQDFANITLNEIDQFAKRFLGLKFYARFMDDITVVVRTKEDAADTLGKIRAFASERLRLEFNEKTGICPAAQGVKTLGFHIYASHMTLSEDSKRREKRRLKAIDRKVRDGRLTEKEAQKQAASWLGHSRHSNSYNLTKKMFSRYPYLKYEDPGWKFGEPSPMEREREKERRERRRQNNGKWYNP